MASHDSNANGVVTYDLGEAIDFYAFGQILDMEDSEDTNFTIEILYGYFEQAEETFQKMDKALKERDLDELCRLGHFLKGSSATIGLAKVRDSCEKIQRYGKKENADGSPEPDEELCLTNIGSTLNIVKSEYTDGRKLLLDYLKGYYGRRQAQAQAQDAARA
ncbi:hpt domain-containing protein [Xylaria sp. CBS 124048]|nr:hpt domain-containing protein [Xylaria sp. CBS 124048]